MIAAAPHDDAPRAPSIHDGVRELPHELRGSVLLLGNFDGLHLGHRALVVEASHRARATGRPLSVLQFDPHPRHYFSGEQGFMISGWTVQKRLLAEAGIDVIFVPRFDAAFAAQPAAVFVTDRLVAGLGVSAVVAGADFRFGQRRGGDAALLQAMGDANGFSTHIVGERCDKIHGARISSSRIRSAIRANRLDEAQRLLGRPFETAIAAHVDGWRFDAMQILPPDGIFKVEARGKAGERLGRRMLVLKGRRAQARLPAGVSTIVWHAVSS
ncbi:FAD synthetase family protein [Terrarubrum flagellatum]|uniref:FAD synthetase family protein n=1 Tax=Terrirubrum flagellatum TaxID=2895980 RepID=UPI00314553CD